MYAVNSKIKECRVNKYQHHFYNMFSEIYNHKDLKEWVWDNKELLSFKVLGEEKFEIYKKLVVNIEIERLFEWINNIVK